MKSMKKIAKKEFAILFTIIFTIFNLLHIVFPCWLIIEDIQNGTMSGTMIEMAAIYPWLLEFISIPFILGQLIYYVALRKVKVFYKFNFAVFIFYLFQVGLFNILLLF